MTGFIEADKAQIAYQVPPRRLHLFGRSRTGAISCNFVRRRICVRRSDRFPRLNS